MRKFTITSLILLFALGTGIYLYNRYILNSTPTPQQVDTNTENPTDQLPEQIPPQSVIKYRYYDEKPVSEGEIYFEKVVKVGTEYVYIASPTQVDESNPPRLIIYSHGSNTTISKDFSDPFMKDMQLYGKYFAKRGFVFSASSLHGANWGSSQSVVDIVDMKSWISKNYLIQEDINIIGYSMGGLATFNYIFTYPNDIYRVALLAPTSREYTQYQFNSIKKIPIQIWHGDKDVNVPLSLSTELFNRYKAFGFKNLNLEIIKDKGHFDIDTELIKEIYEYFKEDE